MKRAKYEFSISTCKTSKNGKHRFHQSNRWKDDCFIQFYCTKCMQRIGIVALQAKKQVFG